LADAGHSVVVFDKGRGLGGRMASRRKDGWRFDHGAVALRPTDDAFATFLATAHDMGHAEAWDAANGWTGVPGMSTVVKSLAHGVEIVSSQRVTGLIKTDRGWIINGPQHAENLIFDRVILAIPHPQAQEILAPWPALSAQIEKAQMQPCWTLMVGFDASLATNITYSDNCADPISVIARETAKPDRDLAGDGWVIQANAEWSRSHLELDQCQIESLLLAAFFKQIACDPVAPAISMAHRWRYALTTTPLGRAYVMDASLGLAVCGDWCLGNTAQAAHDSGRSLAAAIIAMDH
jgi:predicted NAD/FAD-dependent oxidoreductase